MNLDEMHDLALKIAPEFADADLRLLIHQPHWPVNPQALAYAETDPHPWIRDHLKSIGAWSGCFPSCVVFVELGEDGNPPVETLLHELTHLLPAKPPRRDREIFTPAIERQVVEEQARTVRPPNSDPWWRHDLQFIRLACHVHFRAGLHGIDIPLHRMNVAGWTYGLRSSAADYQHALGIEVEAWQRRTFADIEAEPFPPRFLKRFEDDVNFYRQYEQYHNRKETA